MAQGCTEAVIAVPPLISLRRGATDDHVCDDGGLEAAEARRETAATGYTSNGLKGNDHVKTMTKGVCLEH